MLECAHKLVADMFAADDVQIEVDPVVEVCQQVEDIMTDVQIILPFDIADLQNSDEHELDDVETRAGQVKYKVH